MISREMKISVLLVLYNAEKYLEQCLDSILSQDYGNIEVIPVVNGQQKDRTEHIVLDYANSDKRVQTIYNRNNHLICEGLRIAVENVSGQYFIIVDGDDYLLPGALSALFSCAEQYFADVVVGNIVRVSGNGEVTGEIGLPDFTVLYRNDYLLQSFWLMDYLYHAKLYKTDLLKRRQMEYLSVSLGADMLLHYQLVLSAGKVARCRENIHCFRDNAVSISNTVTFEKQVDSFESFLCIDAQLEQNGVYGNPEASDAFKSVGLIIAAQCLIQGGDRFYRRYARKVDELIDGLVFRDGEVRRYLKQWPQYYYLLVVFANNCELGILFSWLLNRVRLLNRRVRGLHERIFRGNQAK